MLTGRSWRGAPGQRARRPAWWNWPRTVLLAADGLTGAQIAERAGCTEPTVIKWCRRYTEAGLTGLEDTPRPGGPETVLTEEVSDKPSDYGSRLLQTQRDVTRHRNPFDLR